MPKTWKDSEANKGGFMEIIYSNDEKSTERIRLSDERKIKFKRNTKSENPLWTVQYFFKKNEMKSLGSISKEQIPVIANGLLMLSNAYSDELNFVARAKYMTTGIMVIEPEYETIFERLLYVGYDEF